MVFIVSSGSYFVGDLSVGDQQAAVMLNAAWV